jgi:hypothetical protein
MRLSAGTRYVWLVCGLAVLLLDAGEITALVDATLGRALAVALGAPGGNSWGGAFATSVVALGVIVTGIGLGLAGGALGKVVHSHLVGPPHR